MSRALFIVIASASLLVYGCIGPTTVSQERTDYADQLAETGRRQFLLNILRAKNNELPQFVDVSQVNDASTAGGSFTIAADALHAGNLFHDINPGLGAIPFNGASEKSSLQP
jgi:hypothetical protein